MAKRRKGRPVDGVLILDKPAGMTSNAALQRVRKLFQAQKAGHTGALDPLATGVLPLCFGEATKFSRYLLEADKAYYATASMGEIRDTGDSDGSVVSQHEVPDFSSDYLEAILEKFRGQSEQIPSMYSALKHQGRPLYEWARKGITVERAPRPIVISLLQMTDQRLDQNELDLKVECSKGTYIRSLVEDIGQELGCGAHVSMLRRYQAGCFGLEQSYGLEMLEQRQNPEDLDGFLLPVDCMLQHLPKVCVNNELSRSILHGQAVRIPDAEFEGLVRVYDDGPETAESGQRFIGVAELQDDGLLQPKRLLSFDDGNVSKQQDLSTRSC